MPASRRLLPPVVFSTVTSVVLALGLAGVASAGVATQASDPIAAKYSALGGTRSVLGSPVGANYATANGGQARDYQNGSIYYTAATGAHELHGLIRDQYRTLGGPAGPLAYPTTDESGTPDGVGRFNHFTGSGGGSVYWTPNTGAHAVYGAIRAKWASLGWETGPLAYPATDENTTPDGTGRYNHFTGGTGGSIYWTSKTAAHAVYGDIRQKWATLGWERGSLGYPTSDEYAISGGRANTFVNGTIAWTASTRATKVTYVANPTPAPTPQAGTNPSTWEVDTADTRKVATEIGPGSLNPPSANGVYGADLGHMFLNNGRLLMTFGDTFGGPAATDFFSTTHSDWRSNVMGVASATADPSRGITFSSTVTDRANHAKELLSSKKIDGNEMTVIPTYGISVGNRAYLHYMSVRKWGLPGQWTLNGSGFGYSDDGGKTWTKAPMMWSGPSNWGQVAMVRNTPDDGYIYVYGIPGGRYGGMKLARVPQNSLLTKSAYQYWDGTGWVTNNEYAAKTIIAGPVGEMSVQYNTYYHKWIMMYLIDSTQQIVLRTADTLTGPWTDAQVVVDSDKYAQLYSPYVMPTNNNGKDIWFTMSMFGPYNVSMMHTSLTPKAPTAALPATLVPTDPSKVVPKEPVDAAAHGVGSTPTTPTGG